MEVQSLGYPREDCDLDTGFLITAGEESVLVGGRLTVRLICFETCVFSFSIVSHVPKLESWLLFVNILGVIWKCFKDDELINEEWTQKKSDWHVDGKTGMENSEWSVMDFWVREWKSLKKITEDLNEDIGVSSFTSCIIWYCNVMILCFRYFI